MAWTYPSAPRPIEPTTQSVRANEAAALQKAGRAVEIVAVKSVALPAGKAVQISYKSNSAPNAVTGKQIRLENDRYFFFKAGRLATLDLLGTGRRRQCRPMEVDGEILSLALR